MNARREIREVLITRKMRRWSSIAGAHCSTSNARLREHGRITGVFMQRIQILRESSALRCCRSTSPISGGTRLKWQAELAELEFDFYRANISLGLTYDSSLN